MPRDAILHLRNKSPASAGTEGNR
ncbi:hypothetical protein A1C_04210 [Rickettsia akari str. Hartford]|uniref:Uncharacterized protein n=1 Tax=Rickettsia akari (strain Hartford) TaxID=293614 RepID=A8GNY9_RICAH|nr:hypothetical protein A1C_04210 [Rickettsia akari str. Hartford]